MRRPRQDGRREGQSAIHHCRIEDWGLSGFIVDCRLTIDDYCRWSIEDWQQDSPRQARAARTRAVEAGTGVADRGSRADRSRAGADRWPARQRSACARRAGTGADLDRWTQAVESNGLAARAPAQTARRRHDQTRSRRAPDRVRRRSAPSGDRDWLDRLVPVGRLDLASTGLLLLTSDTRLADWLTDPRNAIVRRYVVTIRGELHPEAQASLPAFATSAGKPARRES